MSRVKLALAGGLALTAVAMLLALLQTPLTVVRKNGVLEGEEALVTVTHAARFCQAHEAVPRGTTTIEPGLSANTGPRMHLEVRSGGRVLTSGERSAGWNGRVVAIAVKPLARTIPNATICVSFDVHDETIGVHGFHSSLANGVREGNRALPQRMWLNYQRPADHPWISQLRAIVRHMELGRSTGSIWIVLLALLLEAGAVAFTARVVLVELREHRLEPSSTAPKPHVARRYSSPKRRPRSTPRRPRIDPRALAARVPRAAWSCALVAFLSAACWSIITPTFNVPDEPDHFSYVKQLVDTGTRPSANEGNYAKEVRLAMEALGYYRLIEQPEDLAIGSRSEQQELQQRLQESNGISVGSPDAGVATAQPPLYYAYEAIPYAVTSSDPIPDRVQLMRLFSALFAGATALFVFLFVREALPRERWAWTVGGLAVALVPLLGFMSGSVNPDSMLYAVSAAAFYLLARAFHRGLTERLAVAIGMVTAVGLLTKLNFAGMVPGVLLGVAVLSVRAAHGSRRTAARLFAIAAAIGLSPGVLLLVVDAAEHHRLLGPFAGDTALAKGSLLAQFDYIWQLYLPQIPGTVNDFPGVFTARQFWFDGYVGLFGWRDTHFPGWVYDAALIPALALAVLCARALFESRPSIRGRVLELAVYAAMSMGVMAIVGAASFGSFPGVDAEYFEVRYLFPMLALLAAALALAARGAGRHWGPVAGTLIVMLFMAHDILSQMLVIGRYYG